MTKVANWISATIFALFVASISSVADDIEAHMRAYLDQPVRLSVTSDEPAIFDWHGNRKPLIAERGGAVGWRFRCHECYWSEA